MSATIRQIIESPPGRENQGYGHRALKPFAELGLCGGCHQWGADPHILPGTNYCNICDRKLDDVREYHGIVRLAELLEPDIVL